MKKILATSLIITLLSSLAMANQTPNIKLTTTGKILSEVDNYNCRLIEIQDQIFAVCETPQSIDQLLNINDQVIIKFEIDAQDKVDTISVVGRL